MRARWPRCPHEGHAAGRRSRRTHAAADRRASQAVAAGGRQAADRLASGATGARRVPRHRDQCVLAGRADRRCAGRWQPLRRAHRTGAASPGRRSKPAAACSMRCRCWATRRSCWSTAMCTPTSISRRCASRRMTWRSWCWCRIPPHHPQGDFWLDRRAASAPKAASGSPIRVFRCCSRSCSPGREPGRFPLLPWLLRAREAGRLGGQKHAGRWLDIGTPERLRELDAELASVRR